MKETLRLVIVMTIFCLVAGFLLAWTNNVTRAPIEKARKAELADALAKVLPECDNDVVADAVKIADNGTNWLFYVARQKGVFAGAAFQSRSEHGYGGPIEILVGLRSDGTINSMEVLRADNETPGLGSKTKEPKFRDQFRDKKAADTRWAAVTKDGGEIQAITGATISSRAVTEAVKAGLDAFARHADEIKGDGH